jgi:rare lipoprotein A
MSSLHPLAFIPCVVAFAGIVVSASGNSAEARTRHTSHQTHGARAVALDLAHHAGRRIAHHHSFQIAVRTKRHGAGRVVHEAAQGGSSQSFSGMASYYSEGHHVASGGRFNPSGYTCAHRSLPFGTQLRVADPRTGRSVVVTVNDRGPFVHGRVLDLSLGAARALGMTGRGVMHVLASVI